jgi:hypothetical protein
MPQWDTEPLADHKAVLLPFIRFGVQPVVGM